MGGGVGEMGIFVGKGRDYGRARMAGFCSCQGAGDVIWVGLGRTQCASD